MSRPTKSSKNPVAQPSAETIVTFRPYASRAERYAMGKSLREKFPGASHAAWQTAAEPK